MLETLDYLQCAVTGFPGRELGLTHDRYLGGWGDLGSQPQKGIIHYGLAHNRMNPLAGTGSAAIFNTFRRTRNQILYWAVPLLIGYEIMQWSIERCVRLKMTGVQCRKLRRPFPGVEL